MATAAIHQATAFSSLSTGVITTAATFSASTRAIAVDSTGDIFFANYNNRVVEEWLASTGAITTIAGTGAYGDTGDGGPAAQAQLTLVSGLALDNRGGLYISEDITDRVRRVDLQTGIITTYAGIGPCAPFNNGCYSGDGGLASAAGLNSPEGIAFDSAGNLYIADAYNDLVRRVDAQSGIITTVAGRSSGNCGAPECGDGGPATQAGLYVPTSVAVDLSGNLFVDDSYGGAVREVSASTGLIHTVAGIDAQDFGTCGGGYSGDGGPATQAHLYCPGSVTVDSQGNLFIADQSGAGATIIREVLTTTGTIVTIAGGGTGGDGSLATQAFITAETLAVDTADNLYIGGNQAAVKVIGAPGGPWPAAPSTGLLPWRPHRAVRLAAGFVASVDLADGHLTLTTNGMGLPGRRVGLAFDRTYDNASAALRPVATTSGWTSTAMPTIGGVVTGTIIYTDDTGARWPFTFTGSLTATAPYTTYTSPPGLPWQLSVAVAPSTAYTLSNSLTGATRTFNAQGMLLSDADAYGNNNSVGYGSSGPLTLTNSGGRVLKLSYRSGLLSDVRGTNSNGQHVAYTYNGNQQNEVATLTRGVGTTDVVTTTFGYTSVSELGTITTGAGHTWTIGYDLYRRVTSVTSPASGTVGQPGYTPSYTTRFSYNPGGQTQVVEGYGSLIPVTTTYTLDAQGDPIAVTDALSDTTRFAYDAEHDITSTTDARGDTTTYTYTYVGPNGSTGLLAQRTDPPVAAYTTTNSLVSPVTTYSYNPTTYDLTEVDSPEGGRTLYGYDGDHSVITTTQLLQSPPSSGMGCPQVVQRNYAQVAARTDVHTLNSCVSNQWRASVNLLDTYGEITGTVDGRGVDISGNITPTVTLDPANAPLVLRRYAYTPQGDLASVSTPPITTTLNSALRANQPVTANYGYDADGNQTAITSTNGAVTTVGYDHLGRVTKTTQPSVRLYTGSSAAPVETVSYDGDGNVVAATDAAGDTTTRSYDPLGRVIALTNPLGRTAFYTYTATTLAATQDDSGNVTQYGDDAAGQPLAVTDPLGARTQAALDALGNTTAITTPFTYDAHGWLQQDIAGTGGTPPSWQYDANGNLTQALHAGTVLKYSYAVAPGQATPPHALPNELVSTLGTGLSATGYSYDNSGNTAAIVQATNGYSLTYDARDRLTTVVLTDTSGLGRNASVVIAYNARGLRARYTVTRSGQSLPAFDERLLYRGARVGQVAVTGTQVTAPFTETFVYRPTGSSLELLYQQAKQATARYWYVLDGRGNVTALVNATGVAVNHYYYDAWGAPASPDGGITAGTTELVHQPLRYGGYWYDGWDDSLGSGVGQGWNTGALPWYSLGPRGYDPVLERFLQPDPADAGQPAGLRVRQ